MVDDQKVCEHCGQTYLRSVVAARQSLKHWARRKYCGEQCRRAAHVERCRSLTGEAAPAWKGDAAGVQAGRKRCRKAFAEPQTCEDCGAPAERHHIDGNTLNNSTENIAWLCRTHHIRREDRMAYRRKTVTPERLAHKRALAAARQRRYAARKRAAA